MTKYEEVRERLKSRPRLWVVTGAAGFVGSHLVETLLKLEQRVAGLDNFSTGNRGNLMQVKSEVTEGQWRNLRFLEGDIRSPDACRRVCRAADYVLHQAALGSAARSIEQPVGTHDSNLTGFLNMLVAARDSGVSRFVYAGSSSAYGDHPVGPQAEAHVGVPLSPYAATKYMNELYAEVFARCYAFDAIGLRYFSVFGPRQDADGPYAAVVAKWIGNMIRNEPVFINGDGSTTRDFVHVDDVVQANVLAATTEEAAAVNQVYNVALGKTTTLARLYTLIRGLLEPRYPHLRAARPIHRAFRAGDVRHAHADISKAGQMLGYQPRWQLEEGMARTVAWHFTRPAARRALHDTPPRPRWTAEGRAGTGPG